MQQHLQTNVTDFISQRINAMSDGIIAIIITVMVFSVPIPEVFNTDGVMTMLYNIGIFFISFLIVGMQWVKHCNLFSICERITGNIILYNILYLFALSLMPLFTKWIMLHSGEVVPAIAYDITFFALTCCYHLLQNAVLKENKMDIFVEIRQNRNNPFDIILFIVAFFIIGGIVALSFYYPTLSILFFLAMPIIPSFHLLSHKHPLVIDRTSNTSIKKSIASH